jgi:threonylcarbamoyladenosine tRNA methylthiotransferase MtaB
MLFSRAMKVFLSTLGCKLNESELEAWARKFGAEGYTIVDDPQDADLVVLNTCTVTHVAARKSRQTARQLARANPQAKLVITGCYVSVSPDEAQALPNVALIVPNINKDQLVALAGDLLGDVRFQTTETGCRLPEAVSGELQSSAVSRQSSDNRLWSADGGNAQFAMRNLQLRTRAFVKIQDGCNMSCTYCIIPLARGKEHSRPLGEIVNEVRSLVNAGYQEIILTGVQISSFRNVIASAEGAKQSPSYLESATSQKTLLTMTYSLRDLVAAILAETNVPRLRLTSIAPWDLDEALLELFNDPRLCRHLHLSLQSGADTVLRRMRRPYTTAQFARAVELAREKIPDIGITTDVIVGFPGESDTEFEQSLHFVERMQFSRVHVFPYSIREGTLAASLPLQVDDRTKAVRMKQMQAVADTSLRAFAQRFIGKEMMVLWESKDERRTTDDRFTSVLGHSSSVWFGYTDNYIRVLAPSEDDLHNHITAVRLIKTIDDGVIGEVIQKYPK